MITHEDEFQPGDKVVRTGVYSCDGGCDHQYTADEDDVGKRLPTFPPGCHGRSWRLHVYRRTGEPAEHYEVVAERDIAEQDREERTPG